MPNALERFGRWIRPVLTVLLFGLILVGAGAIGWELAEWYLRPDIRP